MTLDGIPAHCPFWVHTSAWLGTNPSNLLLLLAFSNPSGQLDGWGPEIKSAFGAGSAEAAQSGRRKRVVSGSRPWSPRGQRRVVHAKPTAQPVQQPECCPPASGSTRRDEKGSYPVLHAGPPARPTLMPRGFTSKRGWFLRVFLVIAATLLWVSQRCSSADAVAQGVSASRVVESSLVLPPDVSQQIIWCLTGLGALAMLRGVHLWRGTDGVFHFVIGEWRDLR
jgi:hypothetical protein